MSAVSLLILPLVNYFSRRLETQADLYALDITGDALAFVSSMEKLADINLANKTPNRIIEFIFYSHPCVEDRINSPPTASVRMCRRRGLYARVQIQTKNLFSTRRPRQR